MRLTLDVSVWLLFLDLCLYGPLAFTLPSRVHWIWEQNSFLEVPEQDSRPVSLHLLLGFPQG